MKPRYIRVASDLHLEQYAGKGETSLSEKFLPPDERDSESVLVLAGDISSNQRQLVNFLRTTEKRFPKIVYVPGNHEFYGHEMLKWALDFNLEMDVHPNEPKIDFAAHDVGVTELEGVRFIYCTLWGDGGKSLAEQAWVGRGLRDFYVIKLNDKRWTVPDMVALHQTQKTKLVELLKVPFNGITVVVTHHMPSYRLCHPRFGTEINGGFASNCDDILAYDHAPEIWIHGHTHDTGDDKMWKTRIVCNPSGYYFENDTRYKNFKPKFIDLEKEHGRPKADA